MRIPPKKLTYAVLLFVFLGEVLLVMWIFTSFHFFGRWDTPAVPEYYFSSVSLPQVGLPERLIIPSIGVNANVQHVGLDPDGSGNMGVPSNFTDVGWYNGGPRPGRPGSAVIDGHLSGRYIPKAVFHRLDELSKGDIVEVVDEYGTRIQFQVTDTKTYPYDASAAEVFKGNTARPHLNLITCGGEWIKDKEIFTERTVIFTEYIGTVKAE